MVDLFLVLMITGAGDELQGMKKGVLELADAIFINKADGDNRVKALAAKEEYNQILHYLPHATKGWETRAYTCSALTGEGIADLWELVGKYMSHTHKNNVHSQRRKEQLSLWLHETLQSQLLQRFYDHSMVKGNLPKFKKEIEDGLITVTVAAQRLLQQYDRLK